VFDLARLVFVDKTGTSTNLLRLRGRVIRGEGLVDSVLHGRWKTITLLAGLRHDAIVAPSVFNGPFDGKIFRTDVERCLPRLYHGDIVFLDHLATHKLAGVTEEIEAEDAMATYLPAQSPDLDPDRTSLQQAQGTSAKGAPPWRGSPAQFKLNAQSRTSGRRSLSSSSLVRNMVTCTFSSFPGTDKENVAKFSWPGATKTAACADAIRTQSKRLVSASSFAARLPVSPRN
jgi:hypothetical protein